MPEATMYRVAVRYEDDNGEYVVRGSATAHRDTAEGELRGHTGALEGWIEEAAWVRKGENVEPERMVAPVVLIAALEDWMSAYIDRIDAGPMTTDEDLIRMSVIADLRAWLDGRGDSDGT